MLRTETSRRIYKLIDFFLFYCSYATTRFLVLSVELDKLSLINCICFRNDHSLVRRVEVVGISRDPPFCERTVPFETVYEIL